MEWIRSNIASFGGDVSRITMFGQSAGAGLIDMYSFAFHADPIATGFGLLSGIAAGGTPPQRAVDTASAWFNLAGAVGCPKSLDNIAATHRCMMEKDPKALMAPLYTDNYVTDGGPTFYPTIDGITVFDNYNGRPSSPGGYLIGNTDYEAGLFLMYRPDWPDSTWRDLNDEYFTCPSARRSLQVARDKQKVWRYRYFGDFPNSRVTNNPPSGAWHGAEVRLPSLSPTRPAHLILTTDSYRCSSTRSTKTSSPPLRSRRPSANTCATALGPSLKTLSTA